jgi:hypothetical protein
MSAVRRQQHYVLDDAPTQAIPSGAARGAAPLRAVPRGAAGQRGGRSAYAAGWDNAAPHSRATSFPDPSRIISTLVIIGALAIVLYFGITSLIAWTQVKLDDLHYGRPRTSQIDAFVGHGEANGAPTHFVAMNLNRRVTVMEFPGGDVTKPQVIVGPYLFGRAEDLTVVKLRVEDVNADGKADLLVQVKDERLVYVNDGAAFRPITAEELAQLKQQEEGGR